MGSRVELFAAIRRDARVEEISLANWPAVMESIGAP